MPSMRRSAALTQIIIAGVSIAAAALAARYIRTASEQVARLSRLEAENRDLRRHSDALAREMESLRRGAPAPAATGPTAPQDRRGENYASLDQARLLIQLREKLAAANTTIQTLQERVQQLEAQVENVTEENKRLAASEADLKEKIGSTGRVLEAVQTELKGKDDRLAQLKTLNDRLRQDSRAANDKLTQMPRIVQDLEELDRRRETYLSNILRRYRDVTEQYRAIASRLEHPADTAAAAGAELGRIQNSISMAEEDLRQLLTLNAQAARLHQKLAGR